MAVCFVCSALALQKMQQPAWEDPVCSASAGRPRLEGDDVDRDPSGADRWLERSGQYTDSGEHWRRSRKGLPGRLSAHESLRKASAEEAHVGTGKAPPGASW